MATVTKDDPKNLTSGEAKLRAQVESRINQVNEAYRRSLAKCGEPSTLLGMFGVTDPDKSLADSIRGLRGTIDSWAERGRNGSPRTAKGGWRGWVNAGEELITRINALVDSGVGSTLSDIIDTIANAPKYAAKDLADGAKAAVRAAENAANTVNNLGGSIAMGMLKPLAVVAGGYVLLQVILKRGI